MKTLRNWQFSSSSLFSICRNLHGERARVWCGHKWLTKKRWARARTEYVQTSMFCRGEIVIGALSLSLQTNLYMQRLLVLVSYTNHTEYGPAVFVYVLSLRAANLPSL